MGPGEQRGQGFGDSPNPCPFPALFPQMLQLSEFAPVLREIAPGPLTSPSASGIIGLTLEGGGVNRPYDGNLGPSSVCFLGFLLFFF